MLKNYQTAVDGMKIYYDYYELLAPEIDKTAPLVEIACP